MMIVAFPLFLLSTYWGIRALTDETIGEDDKMADAAEIVPQPQIPWWIKDD